MISPANLCVPCGEKKMQATSRNSRNQVRPVLLLAAALFSLVAAFPASAQDQPVALKGAKLLTITHGTIDNGTVVMQGGKITAVGANVAIPANAQIIDATGMTIYPGLIDSETN